VTADITRSGYVGSAVLHLALLAAIVFGIPEIFNRPPPEEHAIAVRLAVIAPETHATQVARDIPKPDAKPEPKEAQVQPPEPPKPEPPKPEQQVEPKPAQKPEPPKQVAKVEPPKPKPPDPNKQKSDFDALLKNLTKRQTAPTPTETDPKAKPQPIPQQQASAQPIAPLGAQLTASEKDLIIQQIERCWSPPSGAKDARDLIVDIHIEVNPDGTVSNLQVMDAARYSGDRFFQAAADSAVRAIKNPQCSPLKLPPGKYEQWKTMTLSFNPKDLL
jgi:outer membrane biosynthesis protein TonB